MDGYFDLRGARLVAELFMDWSGPQISGPVRAKIWRIVRAGPGRIYRKNEFSTKNCFKTLCFLNEAVGRDGIN